MEEAKDKPQTTGPERGKAVANMEDVALVAFLSMKGHRIRPWVSQDKCLVADAPRISFDVLGDPVAIGADMQAYHSNVYIGIQDYVREYRRIKSRMYQIKKHGITQGEGSV